MRAAFALLLAAVALALSVPPKLASAQGAAPTPGSATARGATPGAVEPCAAAITRRETLTDSAGQLLYLAPDALLVRDGSLFIGGHTSARFRRSASGALELGAPNPVVAAIRTPDGRLQSHEVPPQLGQPELRDVRAVPLPNARWGVLLFDRPSPNDSVRVAGPPALWFATLGPGGWERVDRLGIPDDIMLHLPVGRPMVAHGDRLLVAIPAERRVGGAGILLYERTQGRWSSRFLPTDGLAYTGVAIDGATGDLVLLAVHADPDASARDENSLFLLRPDRPDRPRTLVARGGALPVHNPIVHGTPQGVSIGWLSSERTATGTRMVPFHALVRADAPPSPQRLGDIGARIVTVPGASGGVHAVVSHSATMDSITVTIHSLPAPSRGARFTYHSSFAEVLGAARWSASDLIVALTDATLTKVSSLTTELLWVRAQCSPSAEGRPVP